MVTFYVQNYKQMKRERERERVSKMCVGSKEGLHGQCIACLQAFQIARFVKGASKKLNDNVR